MTLAVLALLPAAAHAAAGQVRICASNLTNFDDMPILTVPAGLVFSAWGRATGDLRALRLDPNYPPARTTGESALVITGAAALTADHPCVVAPARALLSEGRGWRSAALAPSDATVYQAVDTIAPGGIRSPGQETPGLAVLLSMNILVASPDGSIANPQTIP